MICCSSKKNKQQTLEITKKRNKILSDFIEEINNEAMTLYQSPNCQHLSIMFQYSGEPVTMKSSSNTKFPKSVERLASPIPHITPRKTSFNIFKCAKTNQNTKYLSTKRGFTLLVTKTNL
ncbi:unnamed protein product [Paramecium primaurelia]|uniref:Uncharacterized protein n=1 Tax=Paramecium primaurelia TaxID=5886 RepID=A0A8S1K263_PARPR|nr:unnamed protein product [Paramecium primaurelia]